MKTTTITSELIAITQQQVCDRLGITMDALAEQMYKVGIAFLYAYYANAHIIATMLEYDKCFWAWWRVEWHQRNELFLDDDEVYNASRCRQILIYRDYNSVERLVSMLRPPRIVTYRIYKDLKRAS